MLVHVYSQDDAAVLAPIANTVVISITSPGNTAPLQEGWDAVLRVKFHGQNHVPKNDPPRGSFPGYKPKPIVPFSDLIAYEIDGFCHANHMKNVMVHCHAGVHRSVAVAWYLHDVFESEIVLHPERIQQRPWENPVYKLLMVKYMRLNRSPSCK